MDAKEECKSVCTLHKRESAIAHPCGSMEELFENVIKDINACSTLESLVCGKGIPKTPKTRSRKSAGVTTAASKDTPDAPFDARKLVTNAVKRCREVRESRGGLGGDSVDATTLSKFARFTDTAALAPFSPFLHYVPRLVNVVTVRVLFT